MATGNKVGKYKRVNSETPSRVAAFPLCSSDISSWYFLDASADIFSKTLLKFSKKILRFLNSKTDFIIRCQ